MPIKVPAGLPALEIVRSEGMEIKELTARFSELEKKLEAGELSENEKKELAKLKGRYYGSFTKGAIKATKKEIKKITDNIESTVEGFIEGIK